MKAYRISEETFNNFINKSLYKNYYQSDKYFKSLELNHIKAFYVGFAEVNNLVGVALVKLSNSFLGIKKAYVPRGIIMDYTKIYNIKAILTAFKTFLNKEGVISAVISPQVVLAIRDKKGNVIKYNKASHSIINEFKASGAIHKGFNFNNESYLPRFEAHINLENDVKTLFTNLNKEVRNKLRKAIKYGIKIYIDKEKNIDKFWFLIKKDKKIYKNYKSLINAFGDDLEIYYSMMNPNIYVENAKKLYENEIEINSYLTNIIESHIYKGKNVDEILSKKLESDKLLYSFKKHLTTATKLLRKYPDGIITSVNIIIKHNNEIYMIEDAYNQEIKHIPSAFLNRWKIIERYANSNYKIFNMGFIAGKAIKKEGVLQNLTNMKLSFGAYQVEYIGEFELIVNTSAYLLLK